MQTIRLSFPDEQTALAVAASLFGIPVEQANTIPADGYIPPNPPAWERPIYFNAIVVSSEKPGYHVLTQIDAGGELTIPEGIQPFIVDPAEPGWPLWG